MEETVNSVVGGASVMSLKTPLKMYDKYLIGCSG